MQKNVINLHIFKSDVKGKFIFKIKNILKILKNSLDKPILIAYIIP